MVPARIHFLIELFLDQTLQDEEADELAGWIDQAESSELDEVLTFLWEKEEGALQVPSAMSQRLLAAISRQQSGAAFSTTAREPTLQRRYFSHRAMAAAAALVAIIITISYFRMQENNKAPNVNVQAAQKTGNEVMPGGNKAILTLADGTVILLDTAANGILAHDENARIEKLAGGRVAYTPGAATMDAPLYNVLATPNGGQYSLQLPDGSRAWLNAASSIRFPSAFTGSERRVQITGEVYFEIASMKRGKKLPFIVAINHPQKKKAEVEVLGTHFNVNTYDDEEVITTTLLEGSLKIRNDNKSRLLVPGQQGQVVEDGEIKLVKNVDLDEAVAWKNGYFEFENAALTTVLRQAARWYNLDIVYEGPIPTDRFTGKIERSVKLSRLLQWMQWSDVKFTLTGNRMIVTH